MTRRNALKASGTVAAGGLTAGCLGSVTGGGSKTVTFLTGESDPKTKEIHNKWKKGFNEETGNELEIVYASYSGGGLTQKLSSMLRGGNAPEVFTAAAGTQGQLMLEDSLLPLTDYFSRFEEVTGEMDPTTYLSRDGEIYTVSPWQKMHMKTIRTDLFDVTLPDQRFDITRKQFLDNVSKINNENDLYGTVLGPTKSGRGTYEAFCYLKSAGVDIWSGPTGNVEVSIDKGSNKQRTIETLEYMQDLYEHAPDGGGYGWAECSKAYTSGSAASLQYSTGRIFSSLLNSNESLIDKTNGILTPFPEKHGSQQITSYKGIGAYSIIEKSDNHEAAAQFLEYLFTNEHYFEWLHTVPFHLMPPTEKLARSEEFRNNDFISSHERFLEFAIEMIPRTIPLPMTADDHGLNLAGGLAYPNGTLGSMLARLLLQGKDPETALTETATDLRSDLEKAQS
jgi:multiple sugar transport system substrate-binding protein